jgi:hypothetical protein
VLGIALVAACAGETIVVTSTSPTTTPVPTQLQAVIPDGPLVSHGSVDGVDHLFVAAATTVDETTHAYIVGFGPDGHRVIEMTWSGDGSDIQQRDPGVDDLGLPLADPGHMPMSLSQEEDGTWTMIGFGVPTAIGADPIFWRATADNPSGPWQEAAVVYEVGGPGAWDGAWIDFPTTFRTEGQRYLLYEGASDVDRNASHLGIAASPDGLSWARPQTPALSPDDCPEVTSIRAPRLLSADAGWLLAFTAITGQEEEPPIRLGMQEDPRQLSCDSVETVLTPDDLPDSGGIHSHALIETETGPALLVESLTPDASASALWVVPLEG